MRYCTSRCNTVFTALQHCTVLYVLRICSANIRCGCPYMHRRSTVLVSRVLRFMFCSLVCCRTTDLCTVLTFIVFSFQLLIVYRFKHAAMCWYDTQLLSPFYFESCLHSLVSRNPREKAVYFNLSVMYSTSLGQHMHIRIHCPKQLDFLFFVCFCLLSLFGAQQQESRHPGENLFLQF